MCAWVRETCHIRHAEGMDGPEGAVKLTKSGSACPVQGLQRHVNVEGTNTQKIQERAAEQYCASCTICGLPPKPEDFYVEY